MSANIKLMTIRRFLIFICSFALISSVCFAGQAAGVTDKKAPATGIQKPVKVMEIIGKVDVVIPHDPVNEIRPKITIISGNGGKHTFVVQPTTTMYDSEWKPTTLDKIIQGQYVNVKYRINKNGYKVALSIEPSRTGSNQPSIPQKRPGENTPRK